MAEHARGSFEDFFERYKDNPPNDIVIAKYGKLLNKYRVLAYEIETEGLVEAAVEVKKGIAVLENNINAAKAARKALYG